MARDLDMRGVFCRLAGKAPSCPTMIRNDSKTFCLACGRLTRTAFCRDTCQQMGARACACGDMLQRRPQESSSNFRKRKTCSEQCRRLAVYDQWRDPEVRARMIRGLRLSQTTDEFVQRARRHMQSMQQHANFIAALHRRRLFTAEQIRAIRTDQRLVREIAAAYGVNRKTIRGIRSRRYYADVLP